MSYGELYYNTNSWADGDSASNYNPIVTPTYFDTDGGLHEATNGNVQFTSTGAYTQYPLGLLQNSAYAFAYNTKCMFYSFAGSAGVSVGGGGVTSTGGTTSGVGMIARTIGDIGTTGKYKFRSVSGLPGARSTVDQVVFDFTKMFFKLSNDSDGLHLYYWFPQVSFNIANSSGTLAIGGPTDTPVFFQNFVPPILTSMYVSFGSSGGLGSADFEASIIATELYSSVYILQNSARVGDTITIVCPAINSNYDDLGSRVGLADLQSIKFSGVSTPVTTFSLVLNANKVPYAANVIVPAGTVSGNITLTSVFNRSNAQNTTDVFDLSQSLVITS